MRIDKKRLAEISEPLSADARATMQARKADRYWRTASSAIAAKVLRQLRIKGMTRVQLAEALNVTPANITRYLNGKCNFELRTLVEIERVLDIRIIDREIIPVNKKTPVIVQVKYNYESGDNSDWVATADNNADLTFNMQCYA